MQAVVLCPGPSLADFEHYGADLLIGVNRAAAARRCDVWAAGDAPMVERYASDVLGTPLLLTDQGTASTLFNAGKLWRGETFIFQDLSSFCPLPLQWDLFSATVALVYAAWRGCSSIRTYGMDWSGTQDFDGVGGFGNRSPERWELERAIILNRLVPWLSGKGITFERDHR
jgi:hypothetical protein